MRIGLVDDNPSILEFMKTVLQLEGHAVSTFLDGATFLQSFRREGDKQTALPYDLLIVDLWLPGGVSGLDILTNLRQTSGLERLPVLLITGAGEQALRPVRAQFPHLPILRKPFTIDVLLAAIERTKKLYE